MATAARGMQAGSAARGEWRRVWAWRGGFIGMAALVWLMSVPQARLFSVYAFGDAGSAMLLPRLTQVLGAPTQAYFFSYGVLSHWTTLLWLRWWGATPHAMMLGDLAVLVAFYAVLSGVGRRLELGWRGRLFLLALFPFMPAPPYPGIENALEAVCLLLALREEAWGRLSRALAACVLALLFKPAMGFFYGAWLLWRLWHREGRVRGWLTGLVAPAATAAGCLLLMLFWYPAAAVLAMEYPWKSVGNYKAMGFGFFHSQGRQFWYPAGKHFAFYLGTPAGVWLLGTLLLFALAIVAWRWPRRLAITPRQRGILITCALLHACDIVFLYSYGGSWEHYSFLMVVGLAAFADLPQLRWRAGMAAMILLAWLGCTTWWRMERGWLALHPQRDMAGLYASDADAMEWSAVIRRAQGHKVLVLNDSGGVGLVVPAVEGPLRWMLLPGSYRAAEMQAVKAQIAAADMVVLPIHQDSLQDDPAWAVVAPLVGNLRLVRRGDYYWIYEHPQGSEEAVGGGGRGF